MVNGCVVLRCVAGEEGSSQAEQEERLPDLPLLSEQLLLDELWDMLGECLKELEESHDQHAVLGRYLGRHVAPLGISHSKLLMETLSLHVSRR